MMRRWIMRAAVGVFVLPVAIQFVPIGATNPPVEQDIPTAPVVKAALRRACYDCRSHETVWPWYARIPPSHG
jgi:Haem-binding domain